MKINEVRVNNKLLKFNTYNFGKVLAGFSIGTEVNYHPSSDIDLIITKQVLKALALKLNDSPLKIRTEHKDKILIDEDSSEADAIISTKGRPIILSPADCIGLILIDSQTHYYGLCHIGRAGVGYNITEIFINKFIEVIGNHDYDLQFIISPNIDYENYPHNSNAFIYTNDEPNWWYNNQELLHEKSGTYYPDLENAVIKQIKESNLDKKHYEITSSGLSTFKDNMHSNSKDNLESTNEKRRNLVFVGEI